MSEKEISRTKQEVLNLLRDSSANEVLGFLLVYSSLKKIIRGLELAKHDHHSDDGKDDDDWKD